jgi:putative PIN family toxin of toxin-antitoxin system
MSQERIVVDTNVFLIYAAYNKLYRLVNATNKYGLIILANTKLIDEFIANFPKVLRKEGLDLNVITSLFREIITEVEVQSVFSEAPDKKDNFLFDIALQHNASFILTEEKALLLFEDSPVPLRNIKWFKETYPVDL